MDTHVILGLIKMNFRQWSSTILSLFNGAGGEKEIQDTKSFL